MIQNILNTPNDTLAKEFFDKFEYDEELLEDIKREKFLHGQAAVDELKYRVCGYFQISDDEKCNAITDLVKSKFDLVIQKQEEFDDKFDNLIDSIIRAYGFDKDMMEHSEDWEHFCEFGILLNYEKKEIFILDFFERERRKCLLQTGGFHEYTIDCNRPKTKFYQNPTDEEGLRSIFKEEDIDPSDFKIFAPNPQHYIQTDIEAIKQTMFETIDELIEYEEAEYVRIKLQNIKTNVFSYETINILTNFDNHQFILRMIYLDNNKTKLKFEKEIIEYIKSKNF